jgi:hypothetical protein
MKWPESVGWLVFILVPGVIWMLGAWANRGHGSWARILGFAVGTDNRLSLSRLQAFLWTLVIFGSFAAAMAIHQDIVPATQAEIEAATKKAKEAVDIAAAKKTAYQSAVAEEEAAEAASKAAQDALTAAEAEAEVRARRAAAAPKETELQAKNKVAQDRLPDLEAALVGKDAILAVKRKGAETALAFWKPAEDAAKKAQNEVPNSAWVQIPAALLALAGYLVLTHLTEHIQTLPTVDSSITALTGVSQAGYLAGKGSSNLSSSP